MKIFKRKHFQALIYSIFLSLPLLSVLGRCVYTIANKNAYQSYYGETINEEIKTQVQYNNLQNNENYLFLNPVTTDKPSETEHTVMFVDNVININGFSNNIDLSNVKTIRFYIDSSYNTFFFRDINDNTILQIGLNNNSLEFSFDFLGFTEQYPAGNGFEYANYFYNVSYNKYSYLDNAFEYSIDRFVSENDYGELDFFTWFSSLFLSGNSLDSLYIHFINWYMNYILYVSLGYLIFSVLLWFVNFFRRLVDDTQNINVGGM